MIRRHRSPLGVLDSPVELVGRTSYFMASRGRVSGRRGEAAKLMAVPQLQAVFFDLDDTLHDDTATYQRAAGRVAGEMAGELGLDPQGLLAAYVAEAERYWSGLSMDQLGVPLAGMRERMWRAALDAVGCTRGGAARACAELYNRYRSDHLQPFPGASALLETLRRHGCKLGLITNGFKETHRDKIALLGFGEAFDEVFIADEVGMIKPDPRLFAHACEALSVAPSAAAMVGDRYERDIREPHALGMYTVWLNRRGETVPADGPQPRAIVGSVPEILSALGFAEVGAT